MEGNPRRTGRLPELHGGILGPSRAGESLQVPQGVPEATDWNATAKSCKTLIKGLARTAPLLAILPKKFPFKQCVRKDQCQRDSAGMRGCFATRYRAVQ